MAESTFKDHLFLGPKSENRQVLMEAIELVTNDYIHWRRNYHPKDPPVIPYENLRDSTAGEFRSTFFQELFSLVSDLKLDVPFFSPRFMAHMVSEVALPGLTAYIATLLYNPNNVSTESSPVTIRFEMDVARQFAELFGYEVEGCFGHLTSGGSIANYESLWYNKAARFLPPAMKLALRATGLKLPRAMPEEIWPLLNRSTPQIETDFHSFCTLLAEKGHDPYALLRVYSIAEHGDGGYRELFREQFDEGWLEPVVLVPQTAHYSWKRAAAVFGMGRRNFLPVDVDGTCRMKPAAFRTMLEKCLREKRPVIQAVAVLGTTEFGTIDPLAELADIRDEFSEQGLYVPIHVDAAYGGYLGCMFRGGHLDEELKSKTRQVWAAPLKKACDAMSRCESVTVDPHKTGYAPYGAGVIVFRHGFLKKVVAESAAYALQTRGMELEDLGKFILEGSKPGAAAAAVWFNHRMMPLNSKGYGTLLLDLCDEAQDFHRLVLKQDRQWQEDGLRFRLISLYQPQSNLAGLLAIPRDARSFSEVNRLNVALSERFGVRDVASIQSYDYLISKTSLAVTHELFSRPELKNLQVDVDELTLLRFVFMNRWVTGHTSNGQSYMSDFLEQLASACETELTG